MTDDENGESMEPMEEVPLKELIRRATVGSRDLAVLGAVVWNSKQPSQSRRVTTLARHYRRKGVLDFLPTD